MAMDKLRLDRLAALCGADLLRGDPACEVTGIEIDSRRLQAGDLKQQN